MGDIGISDTKLLDGWMRIPHSRGMVDDAAWAEVFHGVMGELHGDTAMMESIINLATEAVSTGFALDGGMDGGLVTLTRMMTTWPVPDVTDGFSVVEHSLSFLHLESISELRPSNAANYELDETGIAITRYLFGVVMLDFGTEHARSLLPSGIDGEFVFVHDSDEVSGHSRVVDRFCAWGPKRVAVMLHAFLRELGDMGASRPRLIDASDGDVLDKSYWMLQVLSFVIDRMRERDDWAGPAASGPEGFGRATARAWVDVAASGWSHRLISSFPSVSSYLRWHAAVESNPSVPACASTVDAMAWMFVYGDRSSIGFGVDAVIGAIASGPERDYDFVEDWILRHGNILCIPYLRITPLLSLSSISPPRRLAVLDMVDLLLLMNGENPANPQGIIGSESLAAPFSMSSDGMRTAVDMLARGLPADMVAESPMVRRRRA